MKGNGIEKQEGFKTKGRGIAKPFPALKLCVACESVSVCG